MALARKQSRSAESAARRCAVRVVYLPACRRRRRLAAGPTGGNAKHPKETHVALALSAGIITDVWNCCVCFRSAPEFAEEFGKYCGAKSSPTAGIWGINFLEREGGCERALCLLLSIAKMFTDAYIFGPCAPAHPLVSLTNFWNCVKSKWLWESAQMLCLRRYTKQHVFFACLLIFWADEDNSDKKLLEL